MSDYGSTDRVRRYAAEQYVNPARQRGETTIRINSGSVGKSLVADHVLAPGRYPLICNALKSNIFQKENGLTLLEIQAPSTAASKQSSTITFVYRIERATTSPEGSSPMPEKDALFDRLYGSLRKTYKQLGGAEAFHRAERESWER